MVIEEGHQYVRKSCAYYISDNHVSNDVDYVCNYSITGEIKESEMQEDEEGRRY